MAHELDMSNGRANMAYVGIPPWHGLGQQLTENAPLEIWCKEAGMAWTAEESHIFRTNKVGQMIHVPNKKALYRSDIGTTLSIVGSEYKVVQPQEVLEFYRSLIDGMGYKMETAGVLFGGKRVWALARTGEEFTIMGQDKINGYVLLATSYDGTMATLVTRTSVRVVCMNTLRFAVGDNGQRSDFRLSHMTPFKPDLVKGEIGLEDNAAWQKFQEQATALAERKISTNEAVEFFIKLLYPEGGVDAENTGVQMRLKNFMTVYEGGQGQQVRSAQGTAWGLVNAVTRWVDHERGTRTSDSRLQRAWFGDGDALKNKAFGDALKLVA